MTNTNTKKPRVERVDSIPVIYGLLERMGIQAIADREIEAHGNWVGLSPGWVITLWLTHILNEKNHQMEPVQQWVGRHRFMLARLSCQEIRELDFADDRLAICLRQLAKPALWQAIESHLGQRLIRVYDLEKDLLRLDATLGTVIRSPEKGSIFQVGKAKNGLYETQFKIMMATLDPLGLPLVVDVEPGNRADDPLYIPSYQRAKKILDCKGMLIVGDSKMSALLTRATIVAGGDSYLTPLADKKDEPELLSQLLAGWLKQDDAQATPVFLNDNIPVDGSAPDPTLAIARGFEVTRPRTLMLEGKEVTWNERLLVVQSYSYMKSTLTGLQGRLAKAEAALLALTPPRQRGKKQITEEAKLLSAIEQIEKKYRVQGLFHYDYTQEVTERPVRAYKERPAGVQRQVRYQLSVSRKQTAIEAVEFEAGWRIYATSASTERLSLHQAVAAYRGQIIEENVFRRLHGKLLSITPLYVQREDHAQGLIHLLSLGARLLALGDYLAREALAKTGEELADIYAGNAGRSTPRPTSERMFKACEGIHLVISPQGEHISAFLTDLMPVHHRILALLGLPTSLFSCLGSA
jgi:transposase